VGKSVGIFGANTAQQVVEADLLDEILIHLELVLLGDGTRVYVLRRTGHPRVNLERTAVAESGQILDLRFRVRT